MTSPKERRRARRRAEGLMEQAFTALEDNNENLARKLSQRAIDAGAMNPRLWLDHGRIALLTEDIGLAEEAFRHAIALAPSYAEAFAALADLQARCGKVVQAERLQARAVELAPDPLAEETLASYRVLLQTRPTAAPVAAAPTQFTDRTERFDWTAVEAGLRERGMQRLDGLLSDDECAALIDLWSDPDRFERCVELDDAAMGRGEYRFLTRPLPDLVAAVRAEVYARLAPIANAWHEEFTRRRRFPAALAEFVAECEEAGQYRTTPILLRYPPGGFNAPHLDIAGKIVFPFQLVVTLGPGSSAGGDGGELRLVDDRPGKKVKEKRLGSAPGDGIVFCTRERPVRIGGVYGMQPVQHGVTEVTRERFALGVPFHEHG